MPVSRTRAWLYAIPAAIILLIGLAWMVEVERAKPSGEASFEVTGTSGARANDPEGMGRGDTPLNPVDDGPRVVSDMELLTSKDEYVGRAVEIEAIPVMTVPGPRTFWVGRIANRTLVLVDRQAPPTPVEPGQVVRLSGRLEASPTAEELARAGLAANDREAVDGEEVIIRATRVELLRQDVGENPRH